MKLLLRLASQGERYGMDDLSLELSGISHRHIEAAANELVAVAA